MIEQNKKRTLEENLSIETYGDSSYLREHVNSFLAFYNKIDYETPKYACTECKITWQQAGVTVLNGIYDPYEKIIEPEIEKGRFCI